MTSSAACAPIRRGRRCVRPRGSSPSLISVARPSNVGRDAIVARERKLEAAAQCVSVDGGNERFVRVRPPRRRRAPSWYLAGFLGEVVDVRSAAEDPFAPVKTTRSPRRPLRRLRPPRAACRIVEAHGVDRRVVEGEHAHRAGALRGLSRARRTSSLRRHAICGRARTGRPSTSSRRTNRR